jgi:hypothetical protein
MSGNNRKIAAMLSELRNTLAPLAPALTTAERKRMLSVGDKTLPQVEKAKKIIAQNPHLVPGYLDQDGFHQACTSMQERNHLKTLAREVCRMIDDLIMLDADTVRQEMRKLYHSVRCAKDAKIPGAATAYAEFRTAYRTKQRAKVEAPVEGPCEHLVPAL